MKTMHLLLGNSEQLLTNFLEVLVQDACADDGIVTVTSVRTVETLILQGLTGRFDLAIVIPGNLVPDRLGSRDYDMLAEASEAIRILKRRCSMPILAAVGSKDRSEQETRLRQAGTDHVLELPFHPEECARTVCDLLKRNRKNVPAQMREDRRFWKDLCGSAGFRWMPARTSAH